jgi:hypothetical protein
MRSPEIVEPDAGAAAARIRQYLRPPGPDYAERASWVLLGGATALLLAVPPAIAPRALAIATACSIIGAVLMGLAVISTRRKLNVFKDDLQTLSQSLSTVVTNVQSRVAALEASRTAPPPIVTPPAGDGSTPPATDPNVLSADNQAAFDAFKTGLNNAITQLQAVADGAAAATPATPPESASQPTAVQ